jgi:tetratricopeptide (TPR) repeat protein
VTAVNLIVPGATAVPKRPKQRLESSVSTATLRARAERAAGEARYQQALELAKQLYKGDPSAGHRDLSLTAHLGRAQQLRKQGYRRDAQILLENAAQLAGNDPAWLERLAGELALCGAPRRASELVQRIPGSLVQSRILAQAVDSAVQQGAGGWKQLPEELTSSFDLVLQAFAQLEAGEDDRVRETLQAIGLRVPPVVAGSGDRAATGSSDRATTADGAEGRGATSPFLEWKVFLRGLSAFYHDQDERALENWQRLDPARLPARLAAPLRFQIDPSYRQSQPPAMQAALQKQADRLQASGLVLPLRTLQAALADSEQLASAFRLAEGLIQALRQQFPRLVPRLAACFYWAVVNGGQPEDVRRYERVFGTPADDPGLDRLRALLFEHVGDMSKAHQHWQKFETSVARNPAAWPAVAARSGDRATTAGDRPTTAPPVAAWSPDRATTADADRATTAQRVRALIWCRMGRNAASIPDMNKIPDLPPFLRDHPGRPKPLKPSAPECFQRSLQLAPDLLAAHEELLHYYMEERDMAGAEKAARRLLEHFPEHAPTLEELADIRTFQEDFAESLSLFQRALRVNPLDRSLRRKIGTAHLLNARSHAEAGRFAEARAEYQRALSYREGKDESFVLCKWAACEFKAGDSARGEELLQKALTELGSRLAVAFSMLIETIRLKLPPRLKNRFTAEFKEGLAEPPTAAAAVALAATAAVHQQAKVQYRGQKTHEKQILAYLEKAAKLDFSEEQLEMIADALLELKALKVLRKYTSHARHRFPRNPHFDFLEAESYFAQGPYRFPAWKVQPLLSRAGELARALPPDDKQKALLEKIQQREQMLGISSFLMGPQSMGMLEEIFGGLLDDMEDENDYDDRF